MSRERGGFGNDFSTMFLSAFAGSSVTSRRVKDEQTA